MVFNEWPMLFSKNKLHITPKSLFTNLWREGYYIKCHENGTYNIYATYNYNYKGKK